MPHLRTSPVEGEDQAGPATMTSNGKEKKGVEGICGPKMWPAEKSGCCGVSVLVIRSTQCDLNQYYCEILPAQVMSLWWLPRTSEQP